jgi:hypothetical protein
MCDIIIAICDIVKQKNKNATDCTDFTEGKAILNQWNQCNPWRFGAIS